MICFCRDCNFKKLVQSLIVSHLGLKGGAKKLPQKPDGGDLPERRKVVLVAIESEDLLGHGAALEDEIELLERLDVVESILVRSDIDKAVDLVRIVVRLALAEGTEEEGESVAVVELGREVGGREERLEERGRVGKDGVEERVGVEDSAEERERAGMTEETLEDGLDGRLVVEGLEEEREGPAVRGGVRDRGRGVLRETGEEREEAVALVVGEHALSEQKQGALFLLLGGT